MRIAHLTWGSAQCPAPGAKAEGEGKACAPSLPPPPGTGHRAPGTFPTGHRLYTDHEVLAVRAMTREGFSAREIALRLGCSRQWVYLVVNNKPRRKRRNDETARRGNGETARGRNGEGARRRDGETAGNGGG